MQRTNPVKEENDAGDESAEKHRGQDEMEKGVEFAMIGQGLGTSFAHMLLLRSNGTTGN